jgi:hypothetical protein
LNWGRRQIVVEAYKKFMLVSMILHGEVCPPLSLYKGTSLKRISLPLGPDGRPMPKALWWS